MARNSRLALGPAHSSFAIWRESKRALSDTRPVYFVPTMGALHEGHAALIRRARVMGGADVEVLVSVYVNPTQFNDFEDFESYPKSNAHDVDLALEAGADAVVFPRTEELYPKGIPKRADAVNFGGVTALWEGAVRPGHFDGVVAVVRSLFQQVQPKRAFFGEKDWQQLAVIQKLAALEFGELVIVPVSTRREKNGLAMSSRNARLSKEDRKRAGQLHSTLVQVAQSDDVLSALSAGKMALEEAGFDLEYLALVDGASMAESTEPKPQDRLVVAAHLGGVRLIDNLALEDW